MITIGIIFRNGKEVQVKCTSFRMNYDGAVLTSIHFDGERIPRILHLEPGEIVCIYQKG